MLDSRISKSTAQKSIRHAALVLAPFTRILPKNYPSDKANTLYESETELYGFIKNLYSDMYNNPHGYCIPTLEYDAFVKGRCRFELTKQEKQKEGNLRNKFQHVIRFYQQFLIETGKHGTISENGREILLPADLLETTFKNARLTQAKKYAHAMPAALTRLGVEISDTAQGFSMRSRVYPDMFPALILLCRAESGKYSITNIKRADFRNLLGYTPGLEDVISVLPEDLKIMANDINDFLSGLKCSVYAEPLKETTLFSHWKMWYRISGKPICSVEADVGKIKLCAYFNHYQNVSKMGYALKNESSDIFGWFCNGFYENTCSCKNSRIVDIGGIKKRICGLANKLEIFDPTEKDVKYLKKAIGIYTSGFFNDTI